jgi:SAM-dependent methyltransferase
MSHGVTNPFDSRAAAKRYAAGRIYFHEIPIGMLKERLKLTEPFKVGADVGCGTGLSSRALRLIANRVIATDISPEMIQQAPREDAGIEYIVAPAERLPIADLSVEVMILSCVFHWIDQRKFVAEARRVIRPGGYLVFILHGFGGEMKEEPAFKKWAWEVYPNLYPAPSRHPSELNTGKSLDGFRHCFTEKFVHDVPMTAEQVVGYLLTQSNVIAAIERGDQSAEYVHEALLKHVAPFFARGDSSQLRSCAFHGHVIAQQRLPA